VFDSWRNSHASRDVPRGHWDENRKNVVPTFTSLMYGSCTAETTKHRPQAAICSLMKLSVEVGINYIVSLGKTTISLA
jgi:hypothetical protein